MKRIKKTRRKTKRFSVFFRRWIEVVLMGAAFASVEQERAFVPEWVPLGEAHFKNGVDIPVYGITVQNPMNDGVLKDFLDCRHPVPACRFDFTIPLAQKNRLQLAQIPEVGVMLVPRDWRTVDAAVGADGTESVIFYARQGHKTTEAGKITYTNASACVGCAYSAAAKYFDNAASLAKQNDFLAEKRPPRLHIVKMSEKKVVFSRRINAAMETNGLAWFDPGADLPYFENTVTLPVANHALATTLLNFGTRPVI